MPSPFPKLKTKLSVPEPDVQYDSVLIYLSASPAIVPNAAGGDDIDIVVNVLAKPYRTLSTGKVDVAPESMHNQLLVSGLGDPVLQQNPKLAQALGAVVEAIRAYYEA